MRTSPQSAAHFRMQADPPGDAAHQLDARPAGHGDVLRQFRRLAQGSWRRVPSVSLRIVCQQSRLLKVAVRLLIVNSCLGQQRCSNRRSAEVAGHSATARDWPSFDADRVGPGGRWPPGRSYFQHPVPAGTRNVVLLWLLATCARRPDRPRLPPTDAVIASNAKRAPRCGVLAAGVDPPNCLGEWPPADCATVRAAFPVLCRTAAMPHSERCCGIPARRARTSVSRYRR